MTNSTTIRISFTTKKMLSNHGSHGESFDDIILKILKGRKK